jgi:hypothetical protein
MKQRGRPKFNPTRSQRDLVMTCIAASMTLPQIAHVLGICRTVLCERFRNELAAGRAVRIAENLNLLRRAALRNNVSAMRCLASLYADPDYGQAKPGKKVRAAAAAKSAAVGTPWEDLLAFPARHDDHGDAAMDAMNGQ